MPGDDPPYFQRHGSPPLQATFTLPPPVYREEGPAGHCLAQPRREATAIVMSRLEIAGFLP
jgi:hypothetical protein